MITAENFCHIETLGDGRKVLFFVEFEGEDIIIHQVMHCPLGSVDMSLRMPGKTDELWPDAILFPVAALKIAEDVDSMMALAVED